MTQKSYVKGSAFPALKQGTLRLYSMRFCPFAQRTRLVLAHKHILYETINVHLREKPEWFLEKNPLGKVPVLECSDKVIYESDICDDYLDDVYPESPLNPKDPYVKAKHRILKEHFSSFVGSYYKTLRSNGEDTDALTTMHRTLQILEEFLGTQKFFGGDSPAMLDFHMWPWFERLDPERHSKAMVPEDKFPQMITWIKNMWETEAVKETAFDLQTHRAFSKTSREGVSNYDIGLEEDRQKSHVKGDPFPELQKDTLRLYNMRFCPFAQRTRLVLAHKNIPFETINVSLSEKPDWFFEKNPLGKVPTLEINDKVLYESDICDDYLDQMYPEKPLNPVDPYLKARERILKEQFSPWIINYYKFKRSDYKDEEALDTIYRVAEEFDQLVKGKAFFGGSEPTMLDYHIWPWFERTGAAVFEGKLMPEGRFPNLRLWMTNMFETEAVKATMFDASTHNEFYVSALTGKPNYDIGL